MVPLFIKESDPNAVSSTNISFAFMYFSWKGNNFSLPLSLHIYSFLPEMR